MKSKSNIRPIINFISFFTEKLVLAKLIKKFITPIKYKVPEREKMFYKSAKSKVLFIPSINKEIVVYEYGYSKKKDLLVHGWSGRGSQFYTLADKLLENGRMVISFDAPAHGQSKGKVSSMNEFVEIIKFLNKKYSFEVAIGHSIGAMALLQNVSNGLQIKKLVCIAATNHIDEIISKFLIANNADSNLIQKFKNKFKSKFKNDLNRYNGVIYAKKIKIPTLIIHDSQDRPADVSSAYEIRQSLEQGELLVTHDLGHTRILKSNLINNRIIEFIKDV